MLKQIVKVKTRDGTQVEPLKSIVLATFQYDEQLNTQRQISFVAADDHDLDYALIQENNLVEFDGQDYIIQQLDRMYANGFASVNVTAVHIYTDCHRIMQFKQNEKEQSYSVKDVLDFYFANNKLGFTTNVIGNFDKKRIEGLGGDSAFDGLGKIVSTWTDAVVTQDNKHIVVYQHDSIAKHLGNRLSYGYNSDNIQLTTDVTAVINSFYVTGGSKDVEVTSEETVEPKNTKVKGDKVKKPVSKKKKKTTTKQVPYFDPHIVKDNSSIEKYGEWSGGVIDDDRFKDAKSIDSFAKQQFVLEPPLTITLDYKGNERPQMNELKRFEILENGYTTDIEVVGYSWHPFDDSQSTVVTLNSLKKTSLDYFTNQRKQQSVVKKQDNVLKKQIDNTLNQGLSWDWRGNE